MAVYNGRLYESDPEGLVIKGDVLTSNSIYSLPGDLSTITSIERRELFMPIWFDSFNVDVDVFLNTIQMAIDMINSTSIHNSSNIGLDINHLSAAPENSSIKQGIKKGIKTVIHSQKVG